MRAPASLVTLETACGPIPQSAARPTRGSSRRRSNRRGRLCSSAPTPPLLPGTAGAHAKGSLRLPVEHEDLEGAVRVEHDLRGVGQHLAAGQPLDRLVRRVLHDLLEAQPVLAHEVLLARGQERLLVPGQASLEHDEHEVVVDERLGLDRALAVELLLQAHHRVRDVLAHLAAALARRASARVVDPDQVVGRLAGDRFLWLGAFHWQVTLAAYRYPG